MRFEELSLRIPGDELRMRFHQRVTVLSGLEAPERRGLVESLLGSLTAGPARDTVLTYRDGHGRRVTISRAEWTRTGSRDSCRVISSASVTRERWRGRSRTISRARAIASLTLRSKELQARGFDPSFTVESFDADEADLADIRRHLAAVAALMVLARRPPTRHAPRGAPAASSAGPA